MLFVTVHVTSQTYASSQPSSLNVTMIRCVGATGDHALRTARTGLPAVVCSASGLQTDPSHARVFGADAPFAPVVERYVINAPVGSFDLYPIAPISSGVATAPSRRHRDALFED